VVANKSFSRLVCSADEDGINCASDELSPPITVTSCRGTTQWIGRHVLQPLSQARSLALLERKR
jgi:hypothetical protein